MIDMKNHDEPSHRQLEALAKQLTADGITCFIQEERRYSGKDLADDIERKIEVMVIVQGWQPAGTLTEPGWLDGKNYARRWVFEPSKIVSYVTLRPLVDLLERYGVFIES